MDDDSLELANRLFATATAMLEDAIETAAARQSPHASPRELTLWARRLQVAARDVAALAEAVLIVARTGPENR